MNILVQLSHPAHFHLYKNVIKDLITNGNKVIIVIKSKDILEDLLQNVNLPYVNINQYAHRGSKIGILWDMLVREWRIMLLCKKHKIDLLTGSTPDIAHVGWLLHKWRVNVGEDDLHIIPAFDKIASPFVECVLAPKTCNLGRIEYKTVHYPGFQKLAYLHPKRFAPNKDIVAKYKIDVNSPYFLIRFAKLNAHHDVGVNGISREIANKIVEILAPIGNIYITSERPLEPEFEQYRLNINPLDIHHVMAFATLYIGDSQSMAVEASMLGVPALRFNDFVGKKKIGVMEELEHVYGLTYGISSYEPQQLYDKIQELIAIPNLREEFQARRQRMLDEKIDVTAFLTWFLENYPASAVQHAETDEFWKQFGGEAAV